MSRYRIAWSTPIGELVAIQPTSDEVARHAVALAAAYNDPRNAPLLGNTEAISPDEVVAYYADPGVKFLFLQDGELAGDGDLRNVRGAVAEFAFLVAAPAAQGKGLGTRFATMLHAFAFGPLGLVQVYASIVPANAASRRVFEKLGYAVDASPAGRAFAETPEDIVMSIPRATFLERNAAAVAEIHIAVR